MRLVRFRILTLMIAVAAVALVLAGLLYGPVRLKVGLVVLTAASPILAFLIHFGRKLGLNTLFR